MNDEQTDKFERRVRFVAKHYREGAFDSGKAWEKFVSERKPAENDSSEDATSAGNPLVPSEQSRHAFAGENPMRSASSEEPAFSKKTSPRRSFFRSYGIAAAALAGLLIGISVFYGLRRDSSDWVAVTTVAGQTKEVYLPDSSLVTMAGGSELRYDRKNYGKERRAVEMKGKLFFQVKRRVARPFSVHTRYTEVTVLGTSFQVDARGELTQVHVATGKVRFAASGAGETEEVILTAGMSARYAADRQCMTLAADETSNDLSWKTGCLRFKDTPLEKVIDDLNACYRVSIRNRSAITGMKPLKLTATFRERPLEEVLTVINQTLDIRLAVDSAQ